MKKKLVLFITLIAGVMTPALAGAQMRDVVLECPGHNAVIKTVECQPGKDLLVEAQCPGGQKSTLRVDCDATMASQNTQMGRWGMGLTTQGVAVAGRGPSYLGEEARVFGDLSITENISLHGEAGLGATRIDDQPQWLASGLVGPQWRQSRWAVSALATYHKCGDVVNYRGGELHVQFNLVKNLAVDLFAGLGQGVFVIKKPIEIAPAVIERVIQTELAGSGGLTLNWKI